MLSDEAILKIKCLINRFILTVIEDDMINKITVILVDEDDISEGSKHIS